MSKSNTTEAGVLALLFQATTFAGLANDASTVPVASLYVGLHTADPGETGTQDTNEAAYTGYARVAVARTSSGFSINGSIITPVSNVNFPTSTGTAATITHFSIGVTSTGTGTILYSGTVTPVVAISTGIAPILTSATTITED